VGKFQASLDSVKVDKDKIDRTAVANAVKEEEEDSLEDELEDHDQRP